MPHVERFGAAVPPLRIQNILKKYLLKDFDFLTHNIYLNHITANPVPTLSIRAFFSAVPARSSPK
jgi:hypothetical protein